RALQTPKSPSRALAPALLELASREMTPVEVRLEALAAVPGGLPEVSPALLDFLRAQLDPERPVAARGAAADVLSKAKLTPAQLEIRRAQVRTAGPLELDRLLMAFDRNSSEPVGLKLVAALGQSPARATLRLETLKPRLARYGPRVQKGAETLYAA